MSQVFDQKELDSAPEVCAADPSIRFYFTKAAKVGRNRQAGIVDLHETAQLKANETLEAGDCPSPEVRIQTNHPDVVPIRTDQPVQSA